MYICVLGFILTIVLLNKKTKKNIRGGEKMKNIYDEDLKTCGNKKMKNGSWGENYKCDELGGGVHQICIKNISKNTNNFSKNTGQSNWSENRNNDNHCVCLGAWSLYNKKEKIKKKKEKKKKEKKKKEKKKKEKSRILKCDAIPKNALSDNYVSKFSEGWNKWNGLELNNQIKNGVEELVKNCYYGNKNDSMYKKSQNLKKNYCKFAKNNNALNNTDLYNKLC